jgi:hypothetical protein
MSYQLVNQGAPDLPAAEARNRSSPPWSGAPNRSLWSATLRRLRETFRWRALRVESHGLAQPGWDRQLRRQLLRIEARRIL